MKANNVTPEEKANELIIKYKPNMYCFHSSGMLTNTYDGDVANTNAINCSLYAVDEVLEALQCTPYDSQVEFWNKVKTILENKIK